MASELYAPLGLNLISLILDSDFPLFVFPGDCFSGNRSSKSFVFHLFFWGGV